MGHETLSQFVYQAVIIIAEICGAMVFLTFVVMRALKEIRAIIESGRKDK